jgi:predicted transcriptional regulator
MAVSVKLDEAEQKRLRALSQARSRSSHYLMREAIRQYLDREEARESFKQEALAAWTEYQEAGLHLTGREVAAWLDSWGSDRRKKTPKWHK